jgi:ferredoxin
MAITITDECINCGACEPECPNNAIYEGGAEWKYADGTSLKGILTTLDGNSVDADHAFAPVNMDVYYITHDKCTECVVGQKELHAPLMVQYSKFVRFYTFKIVLPRII